MDDFYIINGWVQMCSEELLDAILDLSLLPKVDPEVIVLPDGVLQKKVDIVDFNEHLITTIHYQTRFGKPFAVIANDGLRFHTFREVLNYITNKAN